MTSVTTTKQKTYFKLDDQLYRSFVLGILLYLYLSFTRGFIYIAVSVLINFLPDAVAAGFGILPLFGLIISTKHKLWSNSLPTIILLWLVAIFIPFLPLRFVFVIIGLFLVYGNLRYMIITNTKGQNISEISLAVVFAVLLDFSMKSPNRGIDPIVFSYIHGYIISAALAVLLFLFMNSNKDSVTLDDFSLTIENKNSLGRNLAVIGLFLNIFIYLFYFANSGFVPFIATSFDTTISSSMAIFIVSIVTGSIVITIHQLENYWTDKKLVLSIVSGIFTLLAVFTYPWLEFFVVLWILGIAGNVFLITISLVNASNLPLYSTRWFSISFLLGAVLAIVFVLVSLQGDGLILQLIIATLAIAFTFLSVVLAKSVGGVE